MVITSKNTMWWLPPMAQFHINTPEAPTSAKQGSSDSNGIELYWTRLTTSKVESSKPPKLSTNLKDPTDGASRERLSKTAWPTSSPSFTSSDTPPGQSGNVGTSTSWNPPRVDKKTFMMSWEQSWNECSSDAPNNQKITKENLLLSCLQNHQK